MKKIFTFFISALLFTLVVNVKMNAQGCNCWPERDTSFHGVPFSYCTSECGSMVAPYYRNDDAATSTLQIVLPFHFCFWGVNQDTIYINNNGNITFGSHGGNFTSFIPDTFPNPYTVVPPMIAPFWGDVDTYRGTPAGADWVDYKITPHYIIVQWDSVGYYNVHTDKVNSFECILSDGTDPIIPKGNNVEFCYRTMQWTTGDASGGSNGFGGDPTVVGANEGDGHRFIQLGLFDSPGFNYYGQFPPSPNYDNVGWLSNKSFFFNLCAGTIAPLISGISPCDTFKVCVGDTLKVPFYFFSPIQGDSVYSNLSPPIPTGVSIILNHPGPTDSMIVQIIGSGANEGYHTINVYGYDNAAPKDTTYSSFVVEIDSAPRIHTTISRDTLCAGDSTTLTASGGTTYIWSPGGQTTSSIRVAPPVTQIYTVGVSINGSCTKDTSLKVFVYPITGVPALTGSPYCLHDSTLFTANSGGATRYDWNFGDPASGHRDSSLLQNTGHVFTSAGTYTVSVKISNGTPCGVRDTSFAVTIFTTPRPIISGIDSTCSGGTVVLNVTGGTTYTWAPGGETTTSVSVTPVTTETITVTASNNGCLHDTTFVLTVVPNPTASITTSKDSLCKGDTLTLMGKQGLKYKWKPGGQTTSVIHVNQNSTTTYTLITYVGSCVDSITKSIPTIPDVTATISATLDSVCPGQSTKITVTPAGGAATYSWSPGGVTSSSITVMPASTMSYTATVTGECNTFTLIQPITVVPFPQPVIQGTNWKCRGVRDTLVASNLNGPATYVWSNGSTATSIKTGPIDGDSSVTLTAYNKLGCPHDTTFFITLRSPLGVTVPPPAIFCAGSLVCISATISGSPTNPVSYSWTPGGGSTDTICVSPTDTTTYIVTVSNGCKSTRATTLTPNYPNLYSCCSQTISIVDDTVTPGKVILSASGNSKTYQWDPATTVTCLNPRCDSVKLNPTPSVTTTYTITGTDSNGCSISQLITITVDVPCFNLIIPNVFTPTNGGSLGLDKVFYINARNMDAWTITIFDRWGKQVFNSTDTYDYWTGNTPSGGAAPAGVYYYVISGTCQGTTYKRDGYVQVIR